jgi:TonB family protein
MRRVGILIVAAAVLFAALPTRTSTAQTQGHPERKVVRKIAPFYPDLAKLMHVSGVVKLEVVVRANGRVKSTKVLGGNPVLIESATNAVFQWRFEAAPVETTEVVQIAFELPQS